MKYAVILLSLIFAITTSTALANDNQDLPVVLPDDANACQDGGTLENKCDTEWEWNCGWYLIRFENGELNRMDFPADCAILLPPLPRALVLQDDTDGTSGLDGEFGSIGSPVNISSLAAGCYKSAGNSILWPGGNGAVTAHYYGSGNLNCSGTFAGTGTYTSGLNSNEAGKSCPAGTRHTSYTTGSGIVIYQCK